MYEYLNSSDFWYFQKRNNLPSLQKKGLKFTSQSRRCQAIRMRRYRRQMCEGLTYSLSVFKMRSTKCMCIALYRNTSFWPYSRCVNSERQGQGGRSHIIIGFEIVGIPNNGRNEGEFKEEYCKKNNCLFFIQLNYNLLNTDLKALNLNNLLILTSQQPPPHTKPQPRQTQSPAPRSFQAQLSPHH